MVVAWIENGGLLAAEAHFLRVCSLVYGKRPI